MPIQAPERGESPVATYVEFATDVAISATTEATANLIVTGASITANGADIYVIDFFCAAVQTSASANSQVRIAIFDNGAPLVAGASTFGIISNTAAAATLSPMLCRRRLQPSAGAHIYDIRGWRTVANGIVQGTAGGIVTPGFISVMKIP